MHNNTAIHRDKNERDFDGVFGKYCSCTLCQASASINICFSLIFQ